MAAKASPIQPGAQVPVRLEQSPELSQFFQGHTRVFVGPANHEPIAKPVTIDKRIDRIFNPYDLMPLTRSTLTRERCEEGTERLLEIYRAKKSHPFALDGKIIRKTLTNFMEIFRHAPEDMRLGMLREFLANPPDLGDFWVRADTLPIYLILLAGSLDDLNEIVPYMEEQDWQVKGAHQSNLLHTLVYGFRHLASIDGQYEACARVLIQNYPALLTEANEWGSTPLMTCDRFSR